MFKSHIAAALKSSNESATDPATPDPNAPPTAGAETPVEVVEVLPEPEYAEAEIANTDAVATDVAETAAVADEVQEIAEGLESLRDLVGGFKDEGLNHQAAAAVNLAVESLLKRAGVSDTGLPSLESFSGQSNRVKSTVLSTEAIAQKAAEMWKALVEILKNIKAKIIAWLKQNLTAAGRVKARAEKLHAAAETAAKSTSAPKETEIDLGPLANKLAVGTAVEEPFTKGIEAVSAVLDDVLSFEEASTKGIMDLRAGIAKAAQSGDAGDAGIVTTVKYNPTKAFKNKRAGKAGEASASDDLHETDALPGNVKFYVGVSALSMGNVKLHYYTSGKDSAEAKAASTKIKTPSVSDLANAAKAALALVEKAQAVAEKAEKQVEDSKRAFADVQIGGEADLKDKVVLHSYMRAFQKAETEHGKAAGRVASYAIDYANTVLTAVQKGLAQYGRAPVPVKVEGAAA